jgi:hypothetical protein
MGAERPKPRAGESPAFTVNVRLFPFYDTDVTLRHPASGIRHPASGIRHPASGIRHPAKMVRAAWPSSPDCHRTQIESRDSHSRPFRLETNR